MEDLVLRYGKGHLISPQGWGFISYCAYESALNGTTKSLFSRSVLLWRNAKLALQNPHHVVPQSLSPKLEGKAAPCPSLREEEGNLGRSSLLFHTNKFLMVTVYDCFYIRFL